MVLVVGSPNSSNSNRLRELAELLNRNPETLRNEYVSKMVRTGHLILRYPDQPRHRQQAYRTRVTEIDGTAP